MVGLSADMRIPFFFTSVTTNYLDWLTSVPWGKTSQENFDLKFAKEVSPCLSRGQFLEEPGYANWPKVLFSICKGFGRRSLRAQGHQRKDFGVHCC